MLCAIVTTYSGDVAVSGESGHRRHKVKDVQITIVRDTVSWPAHPILKLSETLRKNQKSPRFRINWGYVMGSYAGHSTAVFDRSKGTVKFYAYGGGEEGRHKTEHFLFTGVTEDAIHQIASKYKDQPGGGGTDIVYSFLHELPEYGSEKQTLKSK